MRRKAALYALAFAGMMWAVSASGATEAQPYQIAQVEDSGSATQVAPPPQTQAEREADAQQAQSDTKRAAENREGWLQEWSRVWLPEAFAAWMLIPIAAIVLGLIFVLLSTSPSRDPSRKPHG